MSNKAQESVKHVFDNLVVGSKLLGNARKVELTVPFSASNAAGNLRLVESFEELDAIALRTGQSLVEALKK